ncbi:hypothetical protein [Streptomyces sp. NPDC057939]|uniref:hypothetical protein n=1 Tax=Streptomyces sp. NPDC057939 TaxID=3346284 RepID=UPI0036E2DF07
MTQLDSDFEDRLARLKAGLSGDPKVSRSVDRLRLRRPANLLAGVTLHAAARKERRLELTELEESLLHMLRGVISDEEITVAGQAFQEAAPTSHAGHPSHFGPAPLWPGSTDIAGVGGRAPVCTAYRASQPPWAVCGTEPGVSQLSCPCLLASRLTCRACPARSPTRNLLRGHLITR